MVRILEVDSWCNLVNHLSAYVEVEGLFGLSVVLDCMRFESGCQTCFAEVLDCKVVYDETTVVVLAEEAVEGFLTIRLVVENRAQEGAAGLAAFVDFVQSVGDLHSGHSAVGLAA